MLLPGHYGRAPRSLLVLLILLTTSIPFRAVAAPPEALLASRQPPEATTSLLPTVHGSEFTLAAAAFQAEGQKGTARDKTLSGSITVPSGRSELTLDADPTRAPFDFTDIVPRWWADTPDGTSVEVYLRTSRDGVMWGEWQGADPEDTIMPTDAVTETFGGLVSVPQSERTHRYVQSRLILHASPTGLSPVFRELTYSFIDAGVTPNPPRPQVMIQGTPSEIPKPLMVSRLDWGSPQGESSPKWTPKYKRVTHIIIHHTATTNADGDWAARVRAIWFYHANTRKWGDIGYNYIIDPNGVIYEGRAGGDDVEAGHAYPFNSGTMGIGMLGNFMNTEPTAAAQAALIDLISWKASQRGIDPHATAPIAGYTNCDGRVVYDRPTIAGHRDYRGEACGRKFNTSTCPGDVLWAMLPRIRDAVVSEQPPLRANFVQHNTPGNIEPGGSQDVRLSVRNSGSLKWTGAGQGAVSIGYRWLTPENQPVKGLEDGVRMAVNRDVGFADTLETTVKVNAPTVPGHYALVWDMYRDGEGWFSDSGSAPLRVDVVVGRNLGDKTPPTSEVLPLPVYSNNPELPLRWAGEDDPGGAGVASFDIQYRIAPNGQWTDWRSATAETTGTFDAQDGFTYEFRSRARDAAGNVEEWPQQADTYTNVDTRPPPLIIEDPEQGDHFMPGEVTVHGRTEPGTFVAVNDQRAVEAGGVFTSTVQATGRDFSIHVSAADSAGNISRLEVLIQAAPRYSDVNMSMPAFKAIEYLGDRGIISGYSDGSFRPGAAVTRAQMAKLLVQTMQWGIISPPEGRFTDVPSDGWAFPYIETAAARGAVWGYLDGTFEPNGPVSRSDALRMVLATAGKRPIEASQLFTSLPADHWALTCELSSGERPPRERDDTLTYCGESPAARGDVAMLVYDLLRQVDSILEQENTRDDNGPQQ
jgi:hypothetical protein